MADVTITAASVVSGSNAGFDKTANAGATITAGQAVYKDTNGVWQLSDANGVAATRVVNGIALHSASSGQPLAVQNSGDITIGGTVTVGGVYVLSATPGGIAPVADLASGWYTNIIGIGKTASVLTLAATGTQFVTAGVAVP